MLSLLLSACLPPPAPVGPLAGIDQPYAGERSRTAGNARPIAPGESLVLLDVEGPGRVVRWWTTPVESPGVLRSLRVEMYWDGATEPAVRAPLGDFFALGHSEGGEIASLPIVARGTGLTSYWPMPFASHARIVLTNDGATPAAVYFQVDWDRVPAASLSPYRFQASWRREAPTTRGQDMLLADLHGAGQIVGVALQVDPREPGWWGEGDDLYYLDGATTLSFRGTGTEDFALQAWGLRGATSPYAGAIQGTGRRVSFYRWFVADPIAFRTAAAVRMQQMGRLGVDRADDVSATVYWYQAPPLTAVPALPAADARQSAPVLAAQRWAPSPRVSPVDIRTLVDADRFPAEICPASSPHPYGGSSGRSSLSGVAFAVTDGCGDTGSAISLAAGEEVVVDTPVDGAALWLFLAGTGDTGKPALDVDDGARTTVLEFGRHLGSWQDPWPVPDGRIAYIQDVGGYLRGGYVSWAPVDPTADRLVLRARAPVTIYAISRGDAP